MEQVRRFRIGVNVNLDTNKRTDSRAQTFDNYEDAIHWLSDLADGDEGEIWSR